MSSLRDLRISSKFAYAFGAVCVLTAALGITSVIGFMKVNTATDDIVNNSMLALRGLGDMRYNTAAIRRADGFIQLCKTSECVQEHTAKRNKAIDGYKAGEAVYAPTVSYPGEKEIYEAIQHGEKTYMAISNRALDLVNNSKKDEAADLMLSKESADAALAWADAVNADVDLNNKFGKQDGDETIKMGHKLLIWIIVMVVGAVVLSLVIGRTLTRFIVPPIQAASAALEKLAKKDLTVQVDVQSSDEIGVLSESINTSVGSMREVLRNLADSAMTLSTAAEEMSQHASQTKNTTQAQSSKTNQIAAAAQEMTATIGEISHNAEQATESSRNSAEMATKGGEVMQSTAATMERIATANGTV